METWKVATSTIVIATHEIKRVKYVIIFTSNLSLLWFHELPHHGHDVLSTLGLSVGTVQVVESHVLDDFLLLVHVAFRQRHVFFSLEKGVVFMTRKAAINKISLVKYLFIRSL